MENSLFDLKTRKVTRIDTKYRTIQTDIPHPNDVSVMEEIYKLEASFGKNSLPLVWDRASEYSIYDRWGNKWIDLSSGIFVANSGHGIGAQQAVSTASRPLLHSYYYPTSERLNFLKEFRKILPDYLDGRINIVNTGTEASERAIKLARIWGASINPNKTVIIGFRRNFHGKTMGSMMAATTPEAKSWIPFHDPNMVQISFPYPWLFDGLTKDEKTKAVEQFFTNELKNLLKENPRISENNINAFILESYQGWGAIFYPKEFINALSRYAHKHNILLIFDEIQSGFARTGKLFAFEHYNVKPDIVTCGKGISGGLPLSAVIGRKEIMELDSSLSSTHGGNPVACAQGAENLRYMRENDLIKIAQSKGEFLSKLITRWQDKYPNQIRRVCGEGLAKAIFMVDPDNGELDIDLVNQLVLKLFQKGVYSIQTNAGTLKLGPPITIPNEVLEEAMTVHEEAMAEILEEREHKSG